MFPFWVVLSQELVDWVSVRSIDINFREHGELHVVLSLCEGLDLFICPRFLPIKLIARKSQYLKAFFFELLMELHHFTVVPVRETSVTGNVHDHDTFLTFAQFA